MNLSNIWGVMSIHNKYLKLYCGSDMIYYINYEIIDKLKEFIKNIYDIELDDNYDEDEEEYL